MKKALQNECFSSFSIFTDFIRISFGKTPFLPLDAMFQYSVF